MIPSFVLTRRNCKAATSISRCSFRVNESSWRPYFTLFGHTSPDVSAMGTLYDVIVDQSPTIVAGTSASTPTWAGIVTLRAARGVEAVQERTCTLVLIIEEEEE